MPSDEEIDRIEEVQKQMGDYDTERQTPAFRQRQSEITKRRRSDQGGDTDQPSTEQIQQGSQESQGSRESRSSQDSQGGDQQDRGHSDE